LYGTKENGSPQGPDFGLDPVAIGGRSWRGLEPGSVPAVSRSGAVRHTSEETLETALVGRLINYRGKSWPMSPKMSV